MMSQQAADIAREREVDPQQRLGICALQPYTEVNSASRKLMYEVHVAQEIGTQTKEIPLVATGNEREFGKYASSTIMSECTKVIIAKIQKFSAYPNHDYWLIMKNVDGPEVGKLDVVERVSYQHTTEMYGFEKNTEMLDEKNVEDSFFTYDFLSKCDSIDEFANVRTGVNLTTIYLSNNDTQDDSFQISESAAKKMATNLYHILPIRLDENNIMLNLYGDDTHYKCFPDIGEEIKNGILCSIRTQNKSESIYNQTLNRLRTPMVTDYNRILNGTVIDFDIFNNSPDQFEGGPNAQYHRQVRDYLMNKRRYCRQIVEVVENYKREHPEIRENKDLMTSKLERLYVDCYNVIHDMAYIRNKKFSGSILWIVVKEVKPMKSGDKFTNRFGGKGVCSSVVPDELMPMLDNGERIEVIGNKSTVLGRANIGQIFELETNFRTNMFIEEELLRCPEPEVALEKIAAFYDMLSVDYANFYRDIIKGCEDSEKHILLDSVTGSGYLNVVLRPLKDIITIDTLAEIDRKYPIFHQRKMYAPIRNSVGKIRYVESLRPVVASKEYFIRLKQFAEEKFSVTSVSAVNIKNENSKSRNSKMYLSRFSNTPIRFGCMETEDMMHMGVDQVMKFEMIYSASPDVRNNYMSMYFADPVNIDIEMDINSNNVYSQGFIALAKELGIRLKHSKHFKEAVPCPVRIDSTKPAPYFIKKEEVRTPFYIRDDKKQKDEKVDKNTGIVYRRYIDADTGKISEEMPEGHEAINQLNVNVFVKK